MNGPTGVVESAAVANTRINKCHIDTVSQTDWTKRGFVFARRHFIWYLIMQYLSGHQNLFPSAVGFNFVWSQPYNSIIQIEDRIMHFKQVTFIEMT